MGSVDEDWIDRDTSVGSYELDQKSMVDYGRVNTVGTRMFDIHCT